MPDLKVAVLGAGNMGRYLMRLVREGRAGSARMVGVADVPEKRDEVAKLASQIGCEWSTDPRDLPGYDADLVVEAASQTAVRRYAVALLEGGVDLLIMSAGALADPDLFEEISTVAKRCGRRVHVPSGAIGGLDVLRAAKVEGLEEVTLVTSKHPRALEDAPFFDETGTTADVAERTVIFEGPAAEAVRLFPANVNVAAAISLAGLGPQETRVQVVADPSLTANVHEVIARGRFGEMRLAVQNVPSPDNPRTSYLASLSAVATLRRLSEPIVIG